MYREHIDTLIKAAMLEGKKTYLKVLRLIKAEYQTFETLKDNKGNLNVLDDIQEIYLLKKLRKKWNEELLAFKLANRLEDAESLNRELEMLNTLIPAEPSQEETESKIKEIIEKYLSNLPVEERKSMKHLGAIMKLIKTENPLVDGKLVSNIYKKIVEL